jgi:hypothetical protein
MEKELIFMDKTITPIVIQHDDLKFDGKNIVIPSYYVDTILDYINDYKLDGLPMADVEDYQLFRNFLHDVKQFKTNKVN